MKKVMANEKDVTYNVFLIGFDTLPTHNRVRMGIESYSISSLTHTYKGLITCLT